MSLLDTASLLVTPNTYKEGKLYSVIPTNGNGDLTFTRATTATRVNSAGLVELVPYNLLQRSEEFENAYWSKNDGAIAANNTTAPNGTTTADKFTASANNSYHYVNLFTALTVSGSNTFSFYVKKSTATWIFFTFRDSAINYFNLDTGAFGTTPDTCTSQNVGNGWYRITVNKTDTVANCGIGVASGNGGAQFLAAGTEAIFIWGAQLNEGSIKDYQKTETRLNIPRLDYSNGSCPSLLVEPQRTNLALQSSSFDSAAWTKSNSSVTANSTTSPSGIIDADTFTANGITNTHFLQTSSISFVSGTTYTSSVYAKKSTNNFIQIISAIATGGQFANFDLNLGVVGSLGTVSGSNPTASITSVGDGWYRCSMTFTTNATSSAVHTYAIVTSATSPRVESNSLSTSVYLYGAQLEAGAYATSYIPTTSASVTRNQEIYRKTSATTLIGQTEGTFFVDFNYFALISAPSILEVVPLEIGNGTAGNRMYLSVYQGDLYIVIFTGGAIQSLTNIGTLTQGRHKVGISYIANDVRAFLDGSFITSDTAVALPTLSNIYVGSLSNAGPESHSINAVTLWKTRLTNAELEQLTTI